LNKGKREKKIPLNEDIKEIQAHFNDFKFNQKSLTDESTNYIDASRTFEKKL